MRAVADNADGLLKPGMFVTIELPTSSAEPVTQVPITAVQEHEGQTFVFLHNGEDRFERRNVVTGRRSGEFVEITSGLQPGEQVATRGGFALKSRMLADLLAE
jgi:cobalt-zinc-cadmium efflux system membrane fusion protein